MGRCTRRVSRGQRAVEATDGRSSRGHGRLSNFAAFVRAPEMWAGSRALSAAISTHRQRPRRGQASVTGDTTSYARDPDLLTNDHVRSAPGRLLGKHLPLISGGPPADRYRRQHATDHLVQVQLGHLLHRRAHHLEPSRSQRPRTPLAVLIRPHALALTPRHHSRPRAAHRDESVF